MKRSRRPMNVADLTVVGLGVSTVLSALLICCALTYRLQMNVEARVADVPTRSLQSPGRSNAESKPSPTATPLPAAELLPSPTATLLPAAELLPSPTATLLPTAELLPSPTATLLPTAELLPSPTATPLPAAELLPSPTATPLPTAELLPSPVVTPPLTTTSTVATVPEPLSPVPEPSLPADTQVVRPSASSPPTRLVIPKIAVDIPVVPVGVKSVITDGKERQIWSDVADAGAFQETSAYPGNPGNTVINGHRDIMGSVFRDLDRLEIGDEILAYVSDQAYPYLVSDILVVPD
jgi:LPXTG-site transpeptidase (sortase) family protein